MRPPPSQAAQPSRRPFAPHSARRGLAPSRGRSRKTPGPARSYACSPRKKPKWTQCRSALMHSTLRCLWEKVCDPRFLVSQEGAYHTLEKG